MGIPGTIAPPLKSQHIQGRGHHAPGGLLNASHQEDLCLAPSAKIEEMSEGFQQRSLRGAQIWSSADRRAVAYDAGYNHFRYRSGQRLSLQHFCLESLP